MENIGIYMAWNKSFMGHATKTGSGMTDDKQGILLTGDKKM